MIKFFDIYKQDKIFHPILFKKIKKLFKKVTIFLEMKLMNLKIILKIIVDLNTLLAVVMVQMH